MYGRRRLQRPGRPGIRCRLCPTPTSSSRRRSSAPPGRSTTSEYARLRAEAGMPDPRRHPAGAQEEDPGKGPPIVAHRMYPGVRSRSSTIQLDHFLPRYCKAVGLRSEDSTESFLGLAHELVRRRRGSTEWDDFWSSTGPAGICGRARRVRVRDGRQGPLATSGHGPRGSEPSGTVARERRTWRSIASAGRARCS